MKIGKLKLRLRGSLAKPTPLISPVLNNHGINVGAFCARYNEGTRVYPGLEIPVIITILAMNKFQLTLLAPSLSFLLNVFSEAKKISFLNIKKILLLKRRDLYPVSTKKYLKLIQGTLNSMKIRIIL